MVNRQDNTRGSALVYVLNSGNLYGTERMALATLAGMDGYERRVVFAPRPQGNASVAAAAGAAGLETVTFQTRAQFIRRLLPWLLRYRRVDMIGTGVGQGYLAHSLAKLLFVRLRQLQVVHGGTEDWHAYGRKKALNRIPVGVVAVSPYVRDKLVEHGVRAHAISVIDNFLDDADRHAHPPRPPYDAAEAGARPSAGTAVRVAVVSRVDAIKRIDLLVDAVERHGLAEFTFDVYGTGKDLQTLSTRASGLPNLHFHGFVPDVADRLAQADLLLHLCPVEPFGLVVLEAFRSRLLVLVPDQGGAGALVGDGITGLRFRADDGDDLVRALHGFLALPNAARQDIVDAAVVALDERYSQQQGLRRYREALDSVPGQL